MGGLLSPKETLVGMNWASEFGQQQTLNFSLI
jgi:hypothetical protein